MQQALLPAGAVGLVAQQSAHITCNLILLQGRIRAVNKPCFTPRLTAFYACVIGLDKGQYHIHNNLPGPPGAYEGSGIKPSVTVIGVARNTRVCHMKGVFQNICRFGWLRRIDKGDQAGQQAALLVPVKKVAQPGDPPYRVV
jgi:hypothetical protein